MANTPNPEENLQRIEQLTSELNMLKQVHKTQADIMKVRQNKWNEEKEAMEEKKLENMLFDMLKAKASDEEAMNNRLKRINDICDEKPLSI